LTPARRKPLKSLQIADQHRLMLTRPGKAPARGAGCKQSRSDSPIWSIDRQHVHRHIGRAILGCDLPYRASTSHHRYLCAGNRCDARDVFVPVEYSRETLFPYEL
jgi:hypothetical protein